MKFDIMTVFLAGYIIGSVLTGVATWMHMTTNREQPDKKRSHFLSRKN